MTRSPGASFPADFLGTDDDDSDEMVGTSACDSVVAVPFVSIAMKSRFGSGAWVV